MEVTCTEERQGLSVPLDLPVLYTGVVDLIMTPPVEITHFIQLLRNLLKIERIKILSTNGSYDEKSVIKVIVEKPLPLLEALLEMPEIEKTEVLSGSESIPVQIPCCSALQGEQGGQQEVSIVVSFVPAPSNGGC